MRAALALCLALGVAACGSERDLQGVALQAVGELFKPKAPPAPVTNAQIAQALQANANPLILVEFEQRENAQGLLTQVETNGRYHTFGNQARNVIVLRDGMITSTRGLGGDLMSVEEDELLALVRSRSMGQVNYVQRFLTPEAVIEEQRFRCAARPSGGKRVALGLVDAQATAVQVDCYGLHPETGAQVEFTNTYAVSGNGMILSGRQWVGAYLGYIGIQYLRR
ncbi:YjbF family lipoprotein [Sagittula sp. NFXS13]|uniref:YjbF family lipoprotein n=1 Tax=Sagittula sp. NFXS13 TaxID=2819095 RepID=UPI0032DF4358